MKQLKSFWIYCAFVTSMLFSNVYMLYQPVYQTMNVKIDVPAAEQDKLRSERVEKEPPRPETKVVQQGFTTMITVSTSGGDAMTQETKRNEQELPASSQLFQQAQQSGNTNGDTNGNHPAPVLLEWYETAAIQEEVRRHDRLIVEGTAYFGALTDERIDEMNAVAKPITPSDLCITMFASNRKLPYLATLLSTLFKGQSLERLLSFAKLNILNTEHRPHRAEFPFVRKDLAKLEFLNIFNATEMHPLDENTSFNVHFRRDTMTALDICIESGLPYCLILEDDSVVAKGFIDQLETVVIAPIKNHEIAPTLVSLFAHYSSHIEDGHQVYAEKYVASGEYESDRSKMNRERKAKNLGPYTPKFEVSPTWLDFGTVGNVYPLEMAQKLRDFLDSFGMDDSVDPADALMSTEFVKMMGLPKMVVNPSLVNHIGFYSERQAMINILHTDVRFVVDAGEY